MNKKTSKILYYLLSRDTNIVIGNFTFLFILAIAPTLIIISTISKYISIFFISQKNYFWSALLKLSTFLELAESTNLIINIICLTFISNGIYSFLSAMEKRAKIYFRNSIIKNAFSVILSLVFILFLCCSLVFYSVLGKYAFIDNYYIIINFLELFIFTLILQKICTQKRAVYILPGCIISALFLTILTAFFGFIINNFSNIHIYYGILAPIIALILLIYYSCFIIYVGIIINIE